MDQDNKEISMTYDEAVKRKQYLLEQINLYNEALFNDQPLPYSDEEIDKLQEEYQMLNDVLKLTDEERIEKLDDKNKIVHEDGTIEEKKTGMDRLNVFTYLYLIIGTLLVILFSSVLSSGMADSFIEKMNYQYFEQVYDETSDYSIMYTDSSYIMNSSKYYFLVVLFTILIPLIVLLISTICFILSKKLDKINRKWFLYIYLAHVAITVISVILVLFIKILPTWESYYNDYATKYAVYIYSNYYYSGY